MCGCKSFSYGKCEKYEKLSLGGEIGWDHKFLQCEHTWVRFTCDLIELKNFLCHNMFVKHENDAMALWMDLSIYEHDFEMVASFSR